MKTATVVLLVAVAVPAATEAQQVRIVADGTEIRLDPNDSSPVITSMTAGTVLDQVGESGPWYAVRLAGDPGQDDVIGYVLASEVELLGSPAALPTAPPVAAPPPGGVPIIGIPDLSARYEAERSRRSSGVGKLIWGLVISGAAHAALEFVPPLQVPVAEDYDTAKDYQNALDRRSTAEAGRTAATVLGGALGAWGIAQIGFGWRNMRQLELELPRAAEPSLQEQYGDAFQMRAAGRRKVFWAVFLPVLAYGVVEWVPYLGVPDPADFDNADDFNDAVRRRDQAESARRWTNVFGAGLGAWGVTQWVLGARKMSQIEATARMTALSVRVAPSRAEVPVEFFASRRGARTQLGLQWRW